jgi:DNA-binding SARP family transcriptional activator
VRFQVLGPLAVERDGDPVPLGPPLQRKVLAALLVRRNVTVPRRTLLADVWSGDAAVFDEWELDERKRGVLHTYIARLRAVLGPAAIVTEGAGYRMSVADDHLDESRFRELIEQGRARLAAGRPAAAAERLDVAMTLWRGTPLAGWHDEDFARPTVTRLTALRLSALETRAETLLGLERHHDLVGRAGLREWVAEHPDSERLRCALVTALHRTGQTTAASTEAGDGLARLRDSGVPAPRLESLARDLRNPGRPAVPPPAGEMPSRNEPSPAVSIGADRDAAETLNRMVRRQWQAESALRSLHDPEPIPVRWRPAGPEVTDHDGIVRGSVSGRTDRPGELADAFAGLRWRRLVVLGPPGSGKTTLAVLLTLELTARRTPADPAPVLLSVSSWRPESEHLHAWLRRRIAEDYPMLADTARFGGSAILDLVADRRILPILDGLDELPPAARPAALRAINRTAAAGDPLIVTSRLDEYRAAVAAGDVLTGAAVIEAEPVRAADAITYLRHSTPPGERSRRWQPVLDRLSGDPAAPVTAALASPLSVVMARLVYEGSRDPAELTDTGRFPDRAAVDDHLLDELIPTLVDRDAHRDGPRRGPAPEAVRERLTFLARHAHRLGTYDLAWWRLAEAVPALAGRRGRSLVAGALGGAVAFLLFMLGTVGDRGLVGGLLAGLKHGFAYGLGTLAAGLAMDLEAVRAPAGRLRRRRVIANIVRTGLAGGVAAGLVHLAVKTVDYGAVAPAAVVALAYGSGLAVMFGLAPAVAAVPGPTRTDLRLRGRGRQLLRCLGWGLLVGGAAGLAIGVSAQATLVLARDAGVMVHGERLVFGFAPGLVFGLLPGVGASLIRWARTPIALEDASSPGSTLRTDRAQYLALLGMLVAIAVVAFALAAALVLPDGFRAGVRFGLFAGLAGSIVIALVLGFTAAWPRYTLARWWLAGTGRLPWRLTAFLEEAQRLGLLRQAGAVHQFRHASLQDRLVARSAGD